MAAAWMFCDPFGIDVAWFAVYRWCAARSAGPTACYASAIGGTLRDHRLISPNPFGVDGNVLGHLQAHRLGDPHRGSPLRGVESRLMQRHGRVQRLGDPCHIGPPIPCDPICPRSRLGDRPPWLASPRRRVTVGCGATPRFSGSEIRATVIRMISRKGAKAQRKRSGSPTVAGGAMIPGGRESGCEYEYEYRAAP